MEQEQDSNDVWPEVTESARENAKDMASAYDDRPTAVLPGSGNTVTGTAVNDWLDDDGNPKFGDGKTASVDRESVVRIDSSHGLSN